MYDIERQNKIYEYLKEHKSASVNDLADIFFASPSTIRRTLTQMEKMGQVQRTHGGVVYSEKSNEVSILVRQTRNIKEKELVANIAIKYIPEATSIFLDNSSTVLTLAKRMSFKGKTIFTNSVQIAMEIFHKNEGRVFLLGGEVNFSLLDVTGAMTCRNINNFHYDLLLCSCSAVNEAGSYENTFNTADVKQSAIQNSTSKILICDKSKFNATATIHTAKLNEYDLIVANIDDETAQRYRNSVHNLNIRNK